MTDHRRATRGRRQRPARSTRDPRELEYTAEDWAIIRTIQNPQISERDRYTLCRWIVRRTWELAGETIRREADR